MTTIIISSLAEVEPGDLVTLELDGVTVTGPETPCTNRGHVELPYDGSFGRRYACTDDGWKFVTATREVPEEHAPLPFDRVKLRNKLYKKMLKSENSSNADLAWDLTDIVEDFLDRGNK